MHRFVRLAAPVVAALAIAVAGASSALAAAQTQSVSLDADWCFQDGSTQYCFDVDGKAQFVDNQAGSSVTINSITRTTVYESGAYAGESKSVQMFRGVFAADGTVTMQSNVHTRATSGDETCTYKMVLRIVDYEFVLDHTVSTCGA